MKYFKIRKAVPEDLNDILGIKKEAYQLFYTERPDIYKGCIVK